MTNYELIMRLIEPNKRGEFVHLIRGIVSPDALQRFTRTESFNVSMRAGDVLENSLNAAIKCFGLTREGMMSRNRSKENAFARQIVMWFLRTETHMTLSEIARKMNRDHATVLHSRRKIENVIMYDVEYRKMVDCFVTHMEMMNYTRCRDEFNRILSTVNVEKFRVK